tara:strand:- start:2448 stop:2723 length:276 start_codon:yes stop_codon:yes gene_type:complete
MSKLECKNTKKYNGKRFQKKRRKVVTTTTTTKNKHGEITTETNTTILDTPIIINKEKIVFPIKPIQPIKPIKPIQPMKKSQINIEDEYIIC